MTVTPFTDFDAERAVLAGILQHGRDAYIDASELITRSELFQDDMHQTLWSCLHEFYSERIDRRLDRASLVSAAKRLGMDHLLNHPDTLSYLKALHQYRVELGTVREEAAKLLKLQIAQELDAIAAQTRRQLRQLNGETSLSTILATAETPLFEYTAGLISDDHDTHQVGRGIEEWLHGVINTPRENLGIPTPYGRYNATIGGGYRRKTVSVVGARMKQGKTHLADNIALHVAGTLGIPVLNTDTEMSAEEHWSRLLSHLTGIPVERLERGRLSPDEASLLQEKARWLQSIPYYYRSVIDETFEEQVAAMRRWAVKTVGTDADGVRNDCLIIYDYLQLTDAREFKGDFKEYQILGFQMVMLNRLAKRYDLPILTFVQLNREGIDQETTGVFSGSDRILMKASNASILKKKTPEEIEADGPDSGNLKWIVVVARHGPGTEAGDYINLKFLGQTAQIIEGQTRLEMDARKLPHCEKGFDVACAAIEGF